MTPAKNLRDIEDDLGAYAPQRGPAPAEPHQQRTLLAHIGQLEAALAAGERRERALRTSKTQLAQTLAQQQWLNDAMLKSTSWRMTAPLRAAVDAFRTFADRLRGSARQKIIEPDVAAFHREGFIAPVDLFTPAQCALIVKHYRLHACESRHKGHKALAAHDRFFYDLATRPSLLARLKTLLGDDIILWGADLIVREAGDVHDWHTDIESAARDGRFVSVWVGLENTCKGSALHIASGSHQFGKPIQQVIHERGLHRSQVTSEMVAAWACEHDPEATVVQPEMTDGQAVVFDGRLWHASHNTGRTTRSALLLQYAAAGTPVAFPDLEKLDQWPFCFSAERPSSLLVAGKERKNANMPQPAGFSEKPFPIDTHVRRGEGFLESSNGWKPYPLFKGSTPIIAGIKSHVSVLSPGHCPHPPHGHVEEELLVVLDGEAEILIADSPDPADAAVKRYGPGSFVYYPAYQYHTIRNVAAGPVTYLMFKWQAPPLEVGGPLGTTLSDIGGLFALPRESPFTTRLLFEGPTAYLGKLHAHVTELQPGAGYPAHADEYDVAIIVFSGTVETLGKTVGRGGSIYYAAGQLHGMRNVGNDPAKYLVFEFHGDQARQEAAR